SGEIVTRQLKALRRAVKQRVRIACAPPLAVFEEDQGTTSVVQPPRSSREAATECSPRRKAWVHSQRDQPRSGERQLSKPNRALTSNGHDSYPKFASQACLVSGTRT